MDIEKLGCEILIIHSDYGKEFENYRFESFYKKQGIEYNFFAPKTTQQNRVAKKRIEP